MTLMNMECSNCKERMSRGEITGYKINTCFYCNGIWIGGTQLKALLSIEKNAPNINELREYCINYAVISDKRKCPSCINTPLNILNVHNTELDFCLTCNGVFFDENEVKLILTETIESDIKNNLSGYVASEGLLWTLLLLFSGGC